MNSFTLKQIENAVVKKNVHGCLCSPVEVYKTSNEAKNCDNGCCADYYNEAIDAQSSVKLQWRREKLAKRLYYAHLDKFKTIPVWEDFKEDSPTREVYCHLADAIISADINELLEVVK